MLEIDICLFLCKSKVKLFGDISEWPLVKLCLVHCKQTVFLNEFFCQ